MPTAGRVPGGEMAVARWGEPAPIDAADEEERRWVRATLDGDHAAFDRLVERARKEPDDRIVSALVRVNDEDGDRLSDAEIVSMIFLLLFAGHDTTSGLISTGVLALLEHPEQFALLRARPELARSTAVEELLRFCSPVACGAVRRLTAELELHDTTLPPGTNRSWGLLP